MVNQLKVPKEVTNGVVLGKIYPISPAEKAGFRATRPCSSIR